MKIAGAIVTAYNDLCLLWVVIRFKLALMVGGRE